MMEVPSVCERLCVPIVSPLDEGGERSALLRASARLRRVEQWLLYELRHGRAERRLLERLVQLKDEDLGYERNRLLALQEQVDRLKGELGECRRELLDRQKQYTRVYVENVRLHADNSGLRLHLRQADIGCSYRSSHENKSWIHYADTAL